MNRTCSVDGCAKPHAAKGYCQAHYTRMRRHGEPGSAEVWDRARGACSIGDCDRASYGRGMCGMHYLRWHRHDGDTSERTNRKAEHVRWLDREQLNYDAAHDRVKRYRGAPSIHLCDCGQPAEDWAYQHTDPDPLIDERGRPFTDNIEAYAAMCRHCHKTLDWQMKRARVLHEESEAS